MNANHRHVYVLRPGAHGPLRNWFDLLRANRVAPRYWWKAVVITFILVVTLPSRLLERVLIERRARDTRIEHPPVFVLGHWRSGTTHLHNILSQDPQFGYVTTFQAIAPKSFLRGGRLLRLIIERIMPKKRKQDTMDIGLDLPQEEEIALLTTSNFSCYHGMAFPMRMLEYYRSFALFEGIPEDVRAMWKAAYLDICRRATLNMNGRPLLMKSPANTARVATLLEMFPNAKFIHICRNPYRVFPSTMFLYTSTAPDVRLQDLNDTDLEENVLTIYEEVLKRYFESRAAIPPGQLVEVRFEDLEERPMEVLEHIYAELRLPGFDSAAPEFRKYLDTQADYTKNVFKVDEATIRAVNARWAFAIEELGYETLEAPIEPGVRRKIPSRAR